MKVKLLGVVALMALVVASCAGTSSEAEGPSEGIQVHGDWTLDIYNEDGTLDEHVEFSNALTENGAKQLVSTILDLNATPGAWTIDFWNLSSELCPSNNPNPVAPSRVDGACVIDPVSAEAVDNTLGSLEDTIRLTGGAQVEADGEIEWTATYLGACTSGVSSSDCDTTFQNYPFTSKEVSILDWDGDGTANDGPIPVSAGQVVQIQVDISFTSG